MALEFDPFVRQLVLDPSDVRYAIAYKDSKGIEYTFQGSKLYDQYMIHLNRHLTYNTYGFENIETAQSVIDAYKEGREGIISMPVKVDLGLQYLLEPPQVEVDETLSLGYRITNSYTRYYLSEEMTKKIAQDFKVVPFLRVLQPLYL
jgi:hypothetical protein